MNQEVLLQMLRATIPRDRALLEEFLYYQAEHFDEEWDSLIRQFLTNRQANIRPVQVLHFETDVSAFVQASPYDTAHDLLTYTQVFGQNGLQKLDKLSPSEKDLVIEEPTEKVSSYSDPYKKIGILLNDWENSYFSTLPFGLLRS